MIRAQAGFKFLYPLFLTTMYHAHKLLSDVSKLTKEELFADLDTATQQAKSRYASDRETAHTVITNAIGELNYRFPCWQNQYYPRAFAQAAV